MTTVHALEQNLLEQIITHDNLKRAWKRVKANKGAAGVDAITVNRCSATTVTASGPVEARTKPFARCAKTSVLETASWSTLIWRRSSTASTMTC